MTASNLVVPVVLWGNKPPTHCISAVWMSQDQTQIVTGCNDGQICLWDVDSDWKFEPRRLLLGHTAAINCLTNGSNDPDKNYFVSASDNGEMSLWDLKDGRCIESTKKSFIHTYIQAYQLLKQRDVSLVCIGYYADIHIIHPNTLEILYSLSSRMQPDWISALCIIRPISREDDIAVAISNSGTVKVWTLSSAESKVQQPLYEDEAKQTRCLNAQMLRCCPYNQRTVLIVCSKYWQIYSYNWNHQLGSQSDAIYDAGDFSLLCSESSRRNERWLGGDFVGIDKVVVWSSDGKAYLYKLPTNLLRGKALQSYEEEKQKAYEEYIQSSSDPRSESFHKIGDPRSPQQQGPQAYTMLDVYTDKVLECTPAMIYVLGRREKESKILLRGDSEGRLIMWALPEVHDHKMKLVRQESFDKLPVVQPKTVASLEETWQNLSETPEGIIDHLNCTEEKQLHVSSSIYIPTQGRLVCGRNDGSIVIIPAVDAIMLQLLETGRTKDSLQHQILKGHRGCVNCLLYPFNEDARYDINHLISGGADFTVIIWDISNGTKIYTFCVHGGEVTQLLVPPPTCNARILPCVASVASDHSLALLSIKERKCIMLAARQMFPIHIVKWRPYDDFLVIGCIDGTVFVWQMETGHLDRVVHGVTAEEILGACDEKLEVTTNISNLTNPTITITQAFKRANIATFRNFAQQQLQKAQDVFQQQQNVINTMHHPSLINHANSQPILIQGLKTNNRDPESHIVFFDTEALIVELLNEEYSHMSPTKLEALGFFINVAQETVKLSDAQKKVKGFLNKVKDKAENVGQQLQAKMDENKEPSPQLSRRANNIAGGGGGKVPPGRPPPPKKLESSRVQSPEDYEVTFIMKIAQLFLSCLHGWSLDSDLDKLCMSKLGLLKPRKSLSFGLMSRAGHISLLMPGWHRKYFPDLEAITAANAGHWHISSALTTQHLLSVISTANTLMSMTHASFLPNKRMGWSSPAISQQDLYNDNEPNASQQAHTKQGWSLQATLHCVLLPDLIGKNEYKAPLLEILARKWQDRCLEIREAAQALLLGELRRIGTEGRKKVVIEWAPFLPSYVDPALSIISEPQRQGVRETYEDLELDEEDQMLGVGKPKSPQSFETRKKQATAIVMLGVLGAEFGAEMEPNRRKSDNSSNKKNVAEGFGLSQYSHSMHTSKALTNLLLQPATPKLPQYTPIRRAAIDLLGRGFTVWEPYLDVSSVLLGLLELCVDGDQLVPSMTFGLPLCPQADACRTARHSLSLIATARPPAFIITMAKEVARYNAIAQNAQGHHQHGNQQLHNSPLVRAKPEILRVLELLIDKIPTDVSDLLVEVMDIIVHCLDHVAIKNKGLPETFPAICKFSMVGYCTQTRRIAVGAKNGALAFHELKNSKCQVLQGHGGPITAVSFSPDGKYLATYCFHDNRLLFWQTASSSLFGIGSHQTKVIKTYSTPPIRIQPHTNPLKIARLVWVDNRTSVLLSADGTESRFRV